MKTNGLKILIILALMLFFGAGVSLADDRKGDNGKHRHHNSHKYRGDDDDHEHHGRDDYRRYRGYRPEPVHHHHHYHEHFHSYRYDGHWNSWESWEYYKSRNPHYARHGHYERYNNQLVFLFNDGVNAFMFSIGK